MCDAMPLQPLLDDARARKGAGVVFDIDDTILLTANRNLRILREFAREKGVEVRPGRVAYAITDTAREAGLPERYHEELKAFWFARFFTNEYLLSDEPVEGAAAFCAELAALGARVIYMTGRDEAMRQGTEASLRRHGFPEGELVLKPRFDTPDLEFKAQAIAALTDVAGAFENEPLHINMFHDAFPAAKHYLLETKHSGRPVEPKPAVRRIKDFRSR